MYTVYETPSFERMCNKLLKKYHHAKNDCLPLINNLKNGNLIGNQIKGVTHTLFKVRIKSSDLSKGKSGGFRVIYAVYPKQNIYLIAIYSKAKNDVLSVTQLNRFIESLF